MCVFGGSAFETDAEDEPGGWRGKVLALKTDQGVTSLGNECNQAGGAHCMTACSAD